ncbi:MAG: hypothetical protein HUK15_06990 [Bacteroidales bacterium]|nr:hypothetical protein [Bacteroidales bacterium]
MNRNTFFAIIAALMCVSVFVSCEREPDFPEVNTVADAYKLTISDIYKMHADSGDYYTFVDDYMLYGTITMDDSHDNIYKEAYIQDSTGCINLYKLGTAGLVKVGDSVRINLNGAMIVNYSGKMELSFANLEDVSTHVILQDRVNVVPEEVSMSQIVANPAYYDCRLVKLNDVQFAASDTSLTFATASGSSTQNRNMVSCDGSTLVARNSDYADFAGEPIPNGKGCVTGIMTRYIRSSSNGSISTTYQIIIRSLDEVVMNDERCQ